MKEGSRLIYSRDSSDFTKMTSQQIKQKFLEFFKKRGHKVYPPSSLLPKEDPTVLFTTAGMQQFKRFYLEPKEIPAKRIVTIQPCLRTTDILEVGDEKHLTWFEMLGNFSFGYPDKKSYFKKEAIEWAWQFLTSKKEGLGLSPKNLSATYFTGEKNLPADLESKKILEGIPELKGKIKGAPKSENFWGPTGIQGPCGPTVEFFQDGIDPVRESNGVEVWNLVFNQYFFKDEKYSPLKFSGVDTGAGLERLVAVVNKTGLFETDLFLSLVKLLEKLTRSTCQSHEREFRVIVDHVKAIVFILSEGVMPSNKDQGYILRRLIRRTVVFINKLNLKGKEILDLAKEVIKIYQKDYPQFNSPAGGLDLSPLSKEVAHFKKTLDRGLKQFEKFVQVRKQKKILSGKDAFNLYQTYGFPIELTEELAVERELKVDKQTYVREFSRHQEISRRGLKRKFKGGLAGHSEKEIKLHTATHLLHGALRKVLGSHVIQKGSNINPERLRFDFSHPAKLTQEEIRKVEELVNQVIKKDLPVKKEVLSLQDAKKSGAVGVFEEKYGHPPTGGKVSIYTIGEPSGDRWFSKEFCGGPHIERTDVLGNFKIIKEEAVSAGIRRIKAVLE